MKDPKTIVAAITAVAAYIKSEEEAVMALRAMPQAACRGPADRFSPWQMSGRHDQMQMRMQMQLKAYHRK